MPWEPTPAARVRFDSVGVDPLIRTKVSLAGGLQVECRHFAGRGCLAHAAGGLRRWVTTGIGRSMKMAVWDARLRRVRGALAAGGIGGLRRNHRTDCNP